MRRYALLTAVIFSLSLASGSSDAYATDQIDLRVAFKVLPLMTERITGPVNVGIVFDPANNESVSEAESIKRMIDGGMEAPGGVALSSVLVGLDNIDRLSGAKVAVLAKGLNDTGLDKINRFVKGAGILTLSTTIDYVKADYCILGIVSKPSVQIFYSKTAADAGKIGFSQAFTMLVSQI